MAYVLYTPDLEKRDADEAETFAKIAEAFTTLGERVRDNEGQATRVSHAKSTGLLKGEMIVDSDLPAELAQGLFARPGRYEVLARLAQGPGEHLDDRISTHRGLSLKVLNAPGPRIAESRDGRSQDWLLEAGETAFINAKATDFLMNLKAGVANAPRLSQGVKSAVSKASRATNAVLEAVGGGSKTLGFFGHPPHHPLAEAYFSQAPLRWGEHVAKIGVYPDGEMVKALPDKVAEVGDEPDAFRHAVSDYLSRSGATFELRVQLATDIDAMPIENASTRWPEDDSPYRRVAVIRFPPQAGWTAARAGYVDAHVSFQPAHSLEAHRPLGQIMRARLSVYERLVRFRQTTNGQTRAEPQSLAEIPD